MRWEGRCRIRVQPSGKHFALLWPRFTWSTIHGQKWKQQQKQQQQQGTGLAVVCIDTFSIFVLLGRFSQQNLWVP